MNQDQEALKSRCAELERLEDGWLGPEDQEGPSKKIDLDCLHKAFEFLFEAFGEGTLTYKDPMYRSGLFPRPDGGVQFETSTEVWGAGARCADLQWIPNEDPQIQYVDLDYIALGYYSYRMKAKDVEIFLKQGYLPYGAKEITDDVLSLTREEVLAIQKVLLDSANKHGEDVIGVFMKTTGKSYISLADKICAVKDID